jgi:ubiquinone/menaquinone biosynthesis C-methylase UbiE
MADAWDRLARFRDQHTGETGDLWHRSLIDPALRRCLGRVRGLRVLEVACGNGYLARSLAAQGAVPVVGIDRSAESVRRARARERSSPRGVRFERADATHLPFAPGSFDLVVANMALMDIPRADRAIREAARVLAPGGRFVFSISHPCFELDERSVWEVERGFDPSRGTFGETVYRKVRGYREERRSRSPWVLGPRTVVWTESFHRTLATYSRYLRAAGFVLHRLEEPSPGPEMLKKSPQGAYIAEIPLHLVVESIRWDRTIGGSRTSGRTRAGVGRRSGSDGHTARSGSSRRDSKSGS